MLSGKIFCKRCTNIQKRHLHRRTFRIIHLHETFIQLINAFHRSANPIFPHHGNHGIVRQDLHMAIQACTWDIWQRLPNLFDCTGFVNQKILNDPLPNRIHHNFSDLHILLSLLQLFYIFIIFLFLKISRLFYSTVWLCV